MIFSPKLEAARYRARKRQARRALGVIKIEGVHAGRNRYHAAYIREYSLRRTALPGCSPANFRSSIISTGIPAGRYWLVSDAMILCLQHKVACPFSCKDTKFGVPLIVTTLTLV